MKIFKWRNVLWLFIVVSVACATGQKSGERRSGGTLEDPIQLFQVGVMHLNEGHLKEAQDAFREIVLDNPDNAAAWNNLGKAYLLGKQMLDAEAAFNQAIKVVPSFADARNNLGVLMTTLERYEDAEKEFILAQQDSSYRQSPMLWYNMGVLYREQGAAGKAVQYFSESLNRNERYHPALIKRGECYEELGMPGEAVADYRAAVEFAPHDIHLTFQLGRALVKIGKYAEARKHLERVCVIAPVEGICQQSESILKTLP